jgi:hypothetical protein
VQQPLGYEPGEEHGNAVSDRYGEEKGTGCGMGYLQVILYGYQQGREDHPGAKVHENDGHQR